MVIDLSKNKRDNFSFSKKELKNYFKEYSIYHPPECQICKHAVLDLPYGDYYIPRPECRKCKYYPKPKETFKFEEVENLKQRLEKIEWICGFCKYDRKRKSTEEPCLSCIHNIEIDDNDNMNTWKVIIAEDHAEPYEGDSDLCPIKENHTINDKKAVLCGILVQITHRKIESSNLRYYKCKYENCMNKKK